GIQFGLQYATALYQQETVERMTRHFIRLAEAVAANPDVKLGELELITPEESERILKVFNDPQAHSMRGAGYVQDQTLSTLFEQQAANTPDQVAVLCGAESLTYAELNERANRLARTLRAEGVQPDQPVGILVQRSLEMIVGIYAILKAGGAYVPIDPEYPVDRIRFMLEDSGAKLVLTQAQVAEQASLSFDGKVLVLDRPALDGKDIY
ncbi:AMP-binding protein, partial [Paenibacillus sp. Aloe-11]|uniref:AMP-binding protein n=1 Tax=Paenibacillus sp. Aloe-11 TaxID=1050222 RepID=UPI00024EFD87